MLTIGGKRERKRTDTSKQPAGMLCIQMGAGASFLFWFITGVHIRGRQLEGKGKVSVCVQRTRRKEKAS